MADSSQEDEMKLREYQLKLVQAWAELKNKVATMVALANVGLLATVFTFMKDKGPDYTSLFALSSGAFGLLSAGFALVFVWFTSEATINSIIKNEKPDEEIKKLANKAPSLVFTVCVLGGALGFIGAVGAFTGYSQAIYECGPKDISCHLRK